VRKLLIAAIAAAIAVTGFAVTSQADKGKGGSSWTFAFTPNKAESPAGTDSLIEPSYTKSDGDLAETKKTTIFFSEGSAFDTSVPPKCTATGGQLVSSNGEVCKKAQIGSGDALSKVGTLDTAALLKAYNKKNAIYFLVIACEPGTGPGQKTPECTPLNGGTFALEGKLGYAGSKSKPKLTVPTPQTLLDGNIIITKFHLKTCNAPFSKKCKKTVTVNGKKAVRAYTVTPSKCKGKWATKAKIDYDGEPSQTISDTQPCRK
jgi:hypothetical protein